MYDLSPATLKLQLPVSNEQKIAIHRHRMLMKDLVMGKDKRIVVVIGPCSIHDENAARHYGQKLQTLAQEARSFCVCLMRVYIEKARTALGWKGFVYDPNLDDSHNLEKGIYLVRKLFLDLVDMGIPIATEILNPLFLPYFDDLISWGFIGARTSASQPHREIASSLDFPIGFKNSLEGDIDQAVNSMVVARTSHRFPFVNDQGRLIFTTSGGNPFTHVVLRGSASHSNYDSKSLQKTLTLMKSQDLNSRILVDCSHGNCGKNYTKQKKTFFATLEHYKREEFPILGMMVESFLKEGNQSIENDSHPLQYGMSVTDPCIGWQETEELIYGLMGSISSSNLISSTQS